MSGSYQYVDETGVIVPDTTTVLTTVQGEWQGVFGSTLNVDASTPQGVIITGETAARSNVLKNNALVANQINPNLAAGQFLDAIAALFDLNRAGSTPSIYQGIILVGDNNLDIPAGTQAETENGDIFQTVLDVNLGPGGTTTVSMQSVATGQIPAPSGPLVLLSAVLGLTSINAPSPGTVGILGQSDVSFRSLRRATLGKQSAGINGSMKAAVSALPGVLGVQFLENNTTATETISGISLQGNSVWLVVDGGVSTQIAAAMLQSKSQGCGFNGAQVATAVDPITGQTYTIHYDLPTLVPIEIRVTCKQGTYAGNVITDVTSAVQDFANNEIPDTQIELGIVGFYVGQAVSPFEIAAVIGALNPGIYIQKVELALVSGGTFQTTELAMAINQKPSIASGSISVILTT